MVYKSNLETGEVGMKLLIQGSAFLFFWMGVASFNFVFAAPSTNQSPDVSAETRDAKTVSYRSKSSKEQLLKDVYDLLKMYEFDGLDSSLGLEKKEVGGVKEYTLDGKPLKELSEEALQDLLAKSETFFAVQRKKANEDWEDLQRMLEARRLAMNNRR